MTDMHPQNIAATTKKDMDILTKKEKVKKKDHGSKASSSYWMNRREGSSPKK